MGKLPEIPKQKKNLSAKLGTHMDGRVMSSTTSFHSKRVASDTPSNMQWQTIEDAKLKDKTE